MILKLFKSLVLLLIFGISFVGFMELPAILEIEDNLLETGELDIDARIEELRAVKSSGRRAACFVGDSFAKTNYADNNYPNQFRALFEEYDVFFADFTLGGTDFDYHRDLLEKVGELNLDYVIYFYNISDVISLMPEGMISGDKIASITRPNGEKGLSTKDIKQMIFKESRTLRLLKDIIQLGSRKLTGRPLAGSTAGRYPVANFQNEGVLRSFFASVQCESMFILINTPFFAGESVKGWEHYDMFRTMSLPDDVHLMQAIDVVTDPSLAVSWRNGHPKPPAIDAVAQVFMAGIRVSLEDE